MDKLTFIEKWAEWPTSLRPEIEQRQKELEAGLELLIESETSALQEENRRLRELVEGFAQLDETYPDFRSIAGFIVKAKSALKG